MQIFLDVEHSPRYNPGARLENGLEILQPSLTWCNVYVTDFIHMMGLPAPRHWVTSSGDPAAVGRGIELRANALVDWFKSHGGRYGWLGVDRGTAQNAALRGHLAVVGWKNPRNVRPGHVAILIGRDRISQAGRVNYMDSTVRLGFGNLGPLEFFVQMDRPGHNNGRTTHPHQ